MSASIPVSSRLNWTALRQRAVVPCIGGAIFFLLAILVHRQVLAGLDLRVTLFVAPFGNPTVDALGEAIAIAVSSELCLIYAALIAALLWRAGFGWWSVASFAFVFLEPIELLGKFFIYQRPVPSEFYRWVYYPLVTLTLNGSFPSGHAMRSAFFFTFLIVFLITRGGWLARIGPALCLVALLFVGFTRIYLGYHWFSDVVAGDILGVSLGLFVASLLFRREDVIVPQRFLEEKVSA